MVEPQEKSVVDRFKEKFCYEAPNGKIFIEEHFEGRYLEFRDIEQFIRNLQKETDDKWRKRIEDLMEWIELMDWECFEQTQIKKDILDQATNIIKEVTAS